MYSRLITCCCVLIVMAGALPPSVTEHYLPMPIDHAAPWRNRTFDLRYLLDTTHFGPGGPLVVYTGNEGNIEDFANACGFLWVLAERFSGAVVFLEERYYGQSVPTPMQGEPPFAYLSSVQVIADYALAISTLRRELNSSRVLAAGGSYGGMLAAWLRKQHPDKVDAALASSAPVLGFASTLLKQQREGGFWNVTERGYTCREELGAAFRALWSANASDWDRVSTDFGLCPSSRIRTPTALEALIGFLQQQLSALAFANYPYAVGTLPARPTAYACASIVPHAANTAASGWLPLRDALRWHYEDPGECLALQPSFAAYTPGFLAGAWTFQRCTDLVMAFEVASDSRMLLSCSAGFQPNCAAAGQVALSDFCQRAFGVPVPDSAALQAFWGSDWSASGGGRHIVFSNGDLDPWNYGGVPDAVSGGVDGPLTIHIAGGAHHLDLRGPNTADPPAVVDAREREATILGRWLGMDMTALKS